MNTAAPARDTLRDKLSRFGALGFLLLLGGLALAGPYGVLAWGENIALLDQRETRLAVLAEERDELENRVERLSPNNADPDLAAELIRRDLNMIHPDEYVIELREQP
jgi:cell division protein FtsB